MKAQKTQRLYEKKTLLAPKMLLDYIRYLMTIPSYPFHPIPSHPSNPIPTYSCEDNLSIEDIILSI